MPMEKAMLHLQKASQRCFQSFGGFDLSCSIGSCELILWAPATGILAAHSPYCYSVMASLDTSPGTTCATLSSSFCRVLALQCPPVKSQEVCQALRSCSAGCLYRVLLQKIIVTNTTPGPLASPRPLQGSFGIECFREHILMPTITQES